MDQIIKVFIYLITSAIHGESIKPGSLESIDIEKLYKFAVFHQMTTLVAYAFELAGIEAEKFTQSRIQYTVRDATVDYERKKVLNALSDAKIWHMPLKGVILKYYYPSPELRQMADNDILYDGKYTDEVQKIMESMGYKMDPEDEIEHQEVYRKRHICVFEMHSMLFDTLTDRRLYDYYAHIEDKLLGEGYERHFSNEDFYIYLVAHEYKHFCWCGTGLRSLLDVYVFLNRFAGKLDWTYIHREIGKIGITDFEMENRKLALKLFEKDGIETLNNSEKKMLEYFITSGMYGTKEYEIKNQLRRSGKYKYWVERAFLPMESVKYHYPLFYKYKVLLPLLPFYRMVHGWGNMMLEIKTVRAANTEVRKENYKADS